MAKNLEALFSGKPETVQTAADAERGPDLFLTMRAGQSSNLVFLGWLEGGRYDDQPVFFSPILKRAFALPAHTVLLDKLSHVARFTPLVVACTRNPNRETGAAAKYTVQAFPVITDGEILAMLTAAREAFDADVAKLRGGRRGGERRTAAGPGLATDVEPDYDF